MKVWEALTLAMAKLSGHLNTQATDTKNPHNLSESELKAQDLLAFRTIITMLAYTQSHNGAATHRTGPTATDKGDRDALRLLDALSTVFTRQHEIIAVLAKPPYDGSALQVFASVVFSNKAEPLFQPGAESGQVLWSQVCNFVMAMNTRDSKINGHTDSLMNSTSLPFIGDHQDKVPEVLVTAAKENAPVLDIFLKQYWGRESFETHVWMVKTLLGRSAKSKEDLDTLFLYVIAVSFQKMNTRMTDKRFSEPYYHCLLNRTTFPFIELPPTAGKTSHDELFVRAIPILAKNTDTNISHLEHAASLPQPTKIYNESTYKEFHLLLCELLRKFRLSLAELVELHSGMKKCGQYDADMILKALRKVRVFGHYLRTMGSSSAIETHFQVISHFLVVDARKLWTPEETEDPDFASFQRLKPFSLRKGKPLLPWESYRDWLKLMVHYFDAIQVLALHVASWEPKLRTLDTISITILTPPCPDNQMLSWTALLETERYFPTLPGQTSGKDFVKFLKTSYNADTPVGEDNIATVSASTRQLKEQLESGVPMDSLTAIDKLTQQVKKCTSVGRHEVIQAIFDKLVALKSAQPQDQPAQIRTIDDMLATLAKCALFYARLRRGPLCSGAGFSGKHHCEAYIAALLALLHQLGQENFEKQLSMLSEEETKTMKAVLVGIRDCLFAIGVSKRCCPVCAFLLHLLNKHYKTKFIISDEHTNITSCALPESLPADIVYLMVVEFSRRLREELGKLQESTSNPRGRAGTSDTGRGSMDSIRRPEHEGIVEEYTAEAFR